MPYHPIGRWFRLEVLSVSPVTHTHPKRTREHRQWRHSGIIQYHLIGNHQRLCCLRCFPTSLDNTMVGHMTCIWARVADDLLRYSTPTIHGDRRWLYHSKHIQGQAIEAWRHSFSHKLGGNVLSPVIAISPDRTMVSSRSVVSFSGDSHSPETNTRAQAMAA